MPITWRREYMLECEDCVGILMLDDVDTPYKNPTPKAFKRIAIKTGWKIKGNKCWCPECQKEE